MTKKVQFGPEGAKKYRSHDNWTMDAKSKGLIFAYAANGAVAQDGPHGTCHGVWFHNLKKGWLTKKSSGEIRQGREPQPITTLEQFAQAVRNHDLTYSFSDDGGVWRSGETSLERIKQAAKLFAEADVKRIWNAECDRKLIPGPDGAQLFYWR